MKKFLTMFSAALLCLGMAVPAFAEVPELYDLGYRDVTESELFGDSAIKLSKNRSESSEFERRFPKVKETLNIDCANGDIEELTAYLERNVSGFHRDLYQVEMINQNCDGQNDYTVLYGAQVNGFKTSYKVMVLVEDNVTRIGANTPLDVAAYEKLASTAMSIDEGAAEDAMEIAKKEALKAVPDYATVESQEVLKILDEDFHPILAVKTVCIDEDDAYFVLEYVCDLK